ncbi:hypothetical protein K438DRAFT_1944903 [Mycena galopus ATCC 62051]|nr:hypothetical protein K438DRAFT_1944903 [Mycena galopus ATCC 62051]
MVLAGWSFRIQLQAQNTLRFTTKKVKFLIAIENHTSHKPYGAHTKKAIIWLIWLVRKQVIDTNVFEDPTLSIESNPPQFSEPQDLNSGVTVESGAMESDGDPAPAGLVQVGTSLNATHLLGEATALRGVTRTSRLMYGLYLTIQYSKLIYVCSRSVSLADLLRKTTD